jgi:hypothetical protein
MKEPELYIVNTDGIQQQSNKKDPVGKLQKRIHLAKAVLSEKTTEDQLNTLSDALKMKLKGGA